MPNQQEEGPDEWTQRQYEYFEGASAQEAKERTFDIYSERLTQDVYRNYRADAAAKGFADFDYMGNRIANLQKVSSRSRGGSRGLYCDARRVVGERDEEIYRDERLVGGDAGSHGAARGGGSLSSHTQSSASHPYDQSQSRMAFSKNAQAALGGRDPRHRDSSPTRSGERPPGESSGAESSHAAASSHQHRSERDPRSADGGESYDSDDSFGN